VNHKLISTFVEGGSGFNTSDIGAMTDLSLGVSAHDTCVTAGCFPLFALLISAHIHDRKGEHSEVENAWVLAESCIAPDNIVAIMLLEPFLFVKGESPVVFLHLMLPHFFLGHIVEFMSIL
jgi:hypothetical protein